MAQGVGMDGQGWETRRAAHLILVCRLNFAAAWPLPDAPASPAAHGVESERGVVRPLFERFLAKNGVALIASPVLHGGWCLQDGITDTRTPAKFDFKVRPGRVAT